MNEQGSHLSDFKTLSLQFFGKNVSVLFKEGTLCFEMFGRQVHGVLSGRSWGSIMKDGETRETVVALSVTLADGGEITVSCSDIASLAEMIL